MSENNLNDHEMEDSGRDTVQGEIVSTRELSDQDDDFKRAVENKLEFRNLNGGTYKLVRCSDSSEDGKIDINLPDEWSMESTLAIIRDRPSNGRGTPTILRVVESIGDASSTISNQFYIIRETGPLSPEIESTASTRDEAKVKLVEAAINHY